MCLPVTVGGFLLYGDSTLTANFLQSLPNNWLRSAAELLFASQVIAAFIIILNPWSQDVEALFRVAPSEYYITLSNIFLIFR